MKRLTILFLSTAFLWSCEEKQTVKTEDSATTSEIVSADSSTTSSSAANMTEVVNDATVAQSAPVSNTAQKPSLNPPHGEPYHRCDIEVGAPIDSPAPVQNAAPQVQAMQNSFNTNPIQPSAAPAPSASSTAATGLKPALNPPHGEPHHRCDLQVGAPLT